jgi:hypothetical protein
VIYCSYYAEGIKAADFCRKYVPNSYIENFHERKMLFVDITDQTALAKFEFRNPSGELRITSYFSLRFNASSSSWEIVNMDNHDEHNGDESTLNAGLLYTSENEAAKDNVAQVMETFEALYEGYDNLDGQLSQKALHPTADLYCDYYKNGVSGEDYCNRYVPNGGYMDNYSKREMVFIDITGNAAAAKFDYRNPSGGQSVTIYFTLRYYASSSSWQITHGNFMEREHYR